MLALRLLLMLAQSALSIFKLLQKKKKVSVLHEIRDPTTKFGQETVREKKKSSDNAWTIFPLTNEDEINVLGIAKWVTGVTTRQRSKSV